MFADFGRRRYRRYPLPRAGRERAKNDSACVNVNVDVKNRREPCGTRINIIVTTTTTTTIIVELRGKPGSTFKRGKIEFGRSKKIS